MHITSSRSRLIRSSIRVLWSKATTHPRREWLRALLYLHDICQQRASTAPVQISGSRMRKRCICHSTGHLRRLVWPGREGCRVSNLCDSCFHWRFTGACCRCLHDPPWHQLALDPLLGQRHHVPPHRGNAVSSRDSRAVHTTNQGASITAHDRRLVSPHTSRGERGQLLEIPCQAVENARSGAGTHRGHHCFHH